MTQSKQDLINLIADYEAEQHDAALRAEKVEQARRDLRDIEEAERVAEHEAKVHETAQHAKVAQANYLDSQTRFRNALHEASCLIADAQHIISDALSETTASSESYKLVLLELMSLSVRREIPTEFETPLTGAEMLLTEVAETYNEASAAEKTRLAALWRLANKRAIDETASRNAGISNGVDALLILAHERANDAKVMSIISEVASLVQRGLTSAVHFADVADIKRRARRQHEKELHSMLR